MPSLSVHQQKAHKKQRKARVEDSRAATHPSQLAAEEWLAAHPLPAPPAPGSAAVDPLLSAHLSDTAYIAAARAAYSAAQPFPHYTVRALLDDAYCRHLLAVCKLLQFNHRRSDLYRFDQSEDLKAVQSPVIARLRSLLYGDWFRGVLEAISGVRVSGALDATVSVSCAAYSDTHRLLCHDDELQGRRIAYILYLVPDDWTDADGGHLDLFAATAQPPHDPATRDGGDEAAQQPRPVPVAASPANSSLLPAFNAFTFFEVTPRSFHAVREVTSGRQQREGEEPRVRVSISGWFHGEPVYPPSQPLGEADHADADGPLQCLPPLHKSAITRRLAAASAAGPAASPPPAVADVLSLSYWLAGEYCKAAVCRSVAAHFQAESSVELRSFLHPTRYRQLLAAAQTLADTAPSDAADEGAAAGWRLSGPLNRRHYSSYPAAFRWSGDESTDDITRRAAEQTQSPDGQHGACADSGGSLLLDHFSLFLRSAVFADWLHACTGGLRVSALRGEWRRFERGCYTLALDDDPERGREALDVNLCLFDADAVKQVRQQRAAAAGAGNKKGRKRAAASSEWDEEWGGSVHYIAAGLEDEILCSQPAANTLTLVYRAGSAGSEGAKQQASAGESEGEDGGCIRFTEYVTHHCPTPRFDVDIVCRLQDEEADET